MFRTFLIWWLHRKARNLKALMLDKYADGEIVGYNLVEDEFSNTIKWLDKLQPEARWPLRAMRGDL